MFITSICEFRLYADIKDNHSDSSYLERVLQSTTDLQEKKMYEIRTLNATQCEQNLAHGFEIMG